MTFVKGPGTYDAGNRNLDFTIDSLPAGENRSFEIVAKVTGSMGNGACAVNYSVVSASERPNGDDDTAQICVTGQVLGAAKLPVAGVNDLWMVPMAILSGLGGMALFLKK